MLSARGRFKHSGPEFRRGFGLLVLTVVLPVFSLSTLSLPARAQEQAEPEPVSCEVRKTLLVDFTDAVAADTLAFAVSDGPCTAALASVSVTRADGFQVYHYQTYLLDIMPQLIYEPELPERMSAYVERALQRALLRRTKDLPEYAEVAHFYESTGDFVVVDEARYEELRQQNVPILWHKTGESTWVHVIYDPLLLNSQVIMEGRTF